jgi:hypothetical protein
LREIFFPPWRGIPAFSIVAVSPIRILRFTAETRCS